MIHRNFVRLTLILILAAGALICGIASAHRAGYFQSKIGATENSTARSTDANSSELTETLVRGVLLSEFDGWFDLDDKLISPSYVSADFNGDGILDLAAAVRVNREISSDDTTSPGFRFEKPLGGGTIDPPVSPARLPTGYLRRYQDSNAPILVIIHGSRELGLTNTKPEHRFVLVDGWDNGKLKLQKYRGKLKIARAGDEPELVPPPVLRGTALIFLNTQNTGTAVYWDGTAYRWYPVEEFSIK